MIVVDHTGDVGVSIANTKNDVGPNFARVFIQRIAISDLSLHTFVIMAQLDVDHARDRVRTVGRGGAVFQNFDAFDRRFRDRTQIEERCCSAITDRVGRDTTAIDQQQGRLRAEATQ